MSMRDDEQRKGVTQRTAGRFEGDILSEYRCKCGFEDEICKADGVRERDSAIFSPANANINREDARYKYNGLFGPCGKDYFGWLDHHAQVIPNAHRVRACATARCTTQVAARPCRTSGDTPMQSMLHKIEDR